MLLRNFTAQARKTSVSRDASDNFHRKSFQNDRFVRGFLEISKNKLPKRSFRARLLRNFTAQARKTSVSRDASDHFHRKSFQNDRFVRGFLEISKNKLPKRSFRARLPPNFTAQARKTSVSRDASDNFHRKSFQNDRFVRGFLEISKNKLPKRSFRARLLRNFIEQSFAKRTFRAMLPTISTENLRISPQFRAIDPPNPTRGFIQQKQNVRLATTACHPKFQNVRFTTAACAKMYESSAGSPGQPAAYKNHHFTTVSDIWPARSDERARASSKFAFHHSFGRPMSTKRREGRERTQADSHFTSVLDVRRARSDERVATTTCKLRISPQFWTSDDHEVTRGLRRRSHKIRISPQFRTSDEHEVTRGWSPVLIDQTHPA